jgi:hypothetical protein
MVSSPRAAIPRGEKTQDPVREIKIASSPPVGELHNQTVSVGRRKVVDEKALAEALKSGHLAAGAALD